MIDKFGRKIDYLRISVTENCNLKCIYCIDENNILNSCNNDILTDDEIVKIATECARLGIKKIRITGGEPLVRKNIESLINLAVNQNFVPVVDDEGIFIGIIKRSDIINYCYKELKKLKNNK